MQLPSTLLRLPKSDPTTVTTTGLNSHSSELTTQEGSPLYSQPNLTSNNSVRRGFQVFARNCGNCHGMIYKKYDNLLDKAYS